MMVREHGQGAVTGVEKTTCSEIRVDRARDGGEREGDKAGDGERETGQAGRLMTWSFLESFGWCWQ